MEEKKQYRAWYIMTKDHYTYKIIADIIEYEQDEKVIYFKKKLDNQPEPTYDNMYVVAFFPFDEVKFCGVDGFIYVGAIR